MTKILTVFIIFLMVVTGTQLLSQVVNFPKPSPSATITQTVGLTVVEIKYHRPGVKGRNIWGELVPFDKVWRTGANNATTISFSGPVKVQDKELAAGTYGLFTIPGQDSWTVIFSKQTGIWGTNGYKAEEDVLRVQVKPSVADHKEWMEFSFADLTDSSVRVILRWEKLKIDFQLLVATQEKVSKDIKSVLDRYWVTPYQAGAYALKNEMYADAQKYTDLSVKISPTYWNMLQLAKIHKKLARTKKEKRNAIELLKQALLLGKKLPKNQQSYVESGKKLLKVWIDEN